MILKYYKFDKKSYAGFLEYLKSEVDSEYKNFNSNIINTEKKVIGNRIPLIRKCAKEISQGDYKSFIKLNSHNTHEEILIHGLIIGYLNSNYEDTIKMLDEFIIYIDNWAVNDVVSSSLKVFKKDQEKGLSYINSLVNSDNPWFIRFGLTLLLSHYINDKYIDNIIAISSRVVYDHYYVKMANAWLLSMCFVKYKDKIISLLESNVLEKETHNKTIAKIRESRQVSIEDKDIVNKLKRR